MPSKNILQNEDDADKLSGILKVFNDRLKCTTKAAKGNMSDTRKTIPDGAASLNVRTKSMSRGKDVGATASASLGPTNRNRAGDFLLPDTPTTLML